MKVCPTYDVPLRLVLHLVIRYKDIDCRDEDGRRILAESLRTHWGELMCSVCVSYSFVVGLGLTVGELALIRSGGDVADREGL